MHRHRRAPVGRGRGVCCAAHGCTPAQVLAPDTQGQTSIDHVPDIACPRDIHLRAAPPLRSARRRDTLPAWHRHPARARRGRAGADRRCDAVPPCRTLVGRGPARRPAPHAPTV